MIELRNICYEYEGAPRSALMDVSFSIEKGEFFAIVGHNGSGKSTLAKHLNGLYLPNSGDVFVDGMNTRDSETLLQIRQKVGMVFQNPDNQLVTTIVEEDVAFGPENLGIPSEEIRQRVDTALETVGMSEYAKKAPHMLSGGQKQRIAIAGMLAMHPDVLVLDEATSMLDPRGREEVLSTVQRLNREAGMTVIIITQFMEEAVLADRVAVMSQGCLKKLGTPREVFADATVLQEYSLDVPAVVQLRNKLAADGVIFRHQPITVAEMVEELCPLLSKR